MRRSRIPALLAMAPRRGLRGPARAAVLLTLAALAAAAGPTARAEALRLRSGGTLEARGVAVEGEVLVLDLAVGAGQGRVRVPFAQVDPGDLLRVLAPRTPDADAPGQLRLARLALEAGLHAQAVDRATRAGMLADALRPAQAEIMNGVRRRETEAVLAEIELDLRLRQPRAARERARRLLEDDDPVAPPYRLAEQARLLLRLADGLLAAEAPSGAAPSTSAPPAPASPAPALPAEELGVGPPPAAPPAPVPGAPLLPAPPVLPAAAVDALALAARAEETRGRAADPALAPAQREALLSEAAVLLLDARRLLLSLPAPLPAALTARLDRLRTLLTATWLDLADLARGAGAPEVALDRVQAALVLDPESERALDLRRWIERDLARRLLPLPTGPVSYEGAWGPGARAYAAGPGCGCHGGHHGAVRLGGSRSGGASHHAGTRR